MATVFLSLIAIVITVEVIEVIVDYDFTFP